MLPDMLRVVHLLYEPQPGGMRSHLFTLLPALQAAGVSVHLVAGDNWPEVQIQAAALDIPATLLPLRKWGSLNSMLALRRRLPAHDILHIHGQFAGIWGRVAFWDVPQPIIYSPHALKLGKHWLSAIYEQAERFLAPRTDAFILNSPPELHRATIDRQLFPANRCHLIPHSIDLPTPPPQSVIRRLREQLQLPTDAVILLTTSRLHAAKGIDIAIKAVALLQQRFPQIRLLIAGDGPERRSLETLAGEQAAGRVMFLGHREDVEALLRLAAIHLLPAHYEPFGLSALEAMAAGCVCIASGDGPAWILDDAGVVLPQPDPKTFASAIAALIADERRRTQLAQAALERGKGWCDLSKMVVSTQMVYHTVKKETQVRVS